MTPEHRFDPASPALAGAGAPAPDAPALPTVPAPAAPPALAPAPAPAPRRAPTRRTRSRRASSESERLQAQSDSYHPPRKPRGVPTADVPRPATQGLPADRFVNRELAWLAFNERVLEEALDPSVPLLERLKFLAIVSANLDEFFMVRVAGLKRMIDAGVETPFTDGLTPRETLRTIGKRCQDLVTRQHRAFTDDVLPRLDREGVRIIAHERLDDRQRAFLQEYFRKTILPVVTPLAIDPGHPFPFLANRTICLAVQLAAAGSDAAIAGPEPTALIHIPSSVLPRFIRLPSADGRHDFCLLEEVIRAHVDQLFHGYEVKSCVPIRVTRDWDLIIDEEAAGDLLKSIEEGIRARRQGAAVRLQYLAGLPPATLQILVRELELETEDLYETQGIVGLADLLQIYSTVELANLKDPQITPQRVPAFERPGSTFEALRKGDVLVHHPYQSFDYVVRFVREAAEDPKVLAIKMTLYRTGGGASPIVEALCRAARNGKQVAVLMELKARFDEQANIEGARRLEQAGAHVIYGLVGLKTHCKACLVVRREPGGSGGPHGDGHQIRRYVHLSTGNYNSRTAWVYIDYGLFSANEQLCEDVTQIFNVVTGYCKPPRFHHVTMAPFGLRAKIIELIRRERDLAAAGRPARIVAQLNALVDAEVIDELYLAGKAGTKIELIVRGICCLRPRVPGLSENIRVLRIVDRFLEHARVFYFGNDGKAEIYLSSADWMPRNLDRRIELMFPVVDPQLQAQVHEALEVQLLDNVKATDLDADGRGHRHVNTAGVVRSQLKLYEIACRVAAAIPAS
jgi:polyphosphate kinase